MALQFDDADVECSEPREGATQAGIRTCVAHFRLGEAHDALDLEMFADA